MAVGSSPFHLAVCTDRYGVVLYDSPEVQTEVGTSQYFLFNGGGIGKQGAHVKGFKGIMTGAGAGADTVRLYAIDGDSGSATAITGAIDLSALAEDDHFTCGVLEKTARKLKRSDYLRIDTASDALCLVWVTLAPYEVTV